MGGCTPTGSACSPSFWEAGHLVFLLIQVELESSSVFCSCMILEICHPLHAYMSAVTTGNAGWGQVGL